MSLDSRLARFKTQTRTAPELWPEIQRRRTEGPEWPSTREVSAWRRVAVAVVALMIAAAGSTLAIIAIRGGPGSVQTAAPASNGPIVLVGIADSEPPSPYGGPRSLWMLDPTTGELSKLLAPIETAGLEVLAPRWSTDGSHVLWFTSDSHDGPGEIWAEVDGTITKIVSCPGRSGCVWDPAWSPDRMSVAFARGTSIMAVHADGTGLRELAECPGCTGLESGPAWSPDGARLAFAASDARYAGVIYVVNLDGSGTRAIANCDSDLCLAGDRNANLSWSPTGDSLIFTRERNLWSVGPDGGDLTRLTSCEVTQGPNECAPQSVEWSPDGTKIAYVDGSNRLTIMDASGTEAHAIALRDGFSFYLDAWQPSQPRADVSPSIVPVPDVTRLRVHEARKMLEGVGLEVETRRGRSADVAEGLVIKQDPAPGIQVGMGATVTLVVSTGVRGQPAFDLGEVVFRGRTNDCFWTLRVDIITGGAGGGLITLTSADGEVLEQLLVGTSSQAPALQLRSFTCADPERAVLVFGLAAPNVVDVQWDASPGGADGGPPECIDSSFPERFCLILEDFTSVGEAIAYDAGGNEVGRATFG